MRDYAGFVDTRATMLALRPGTKGHWISFAVAHHLNGDHALAAGALETFQNMQARPREHLLPASLCGWDGAERLLSGAGSSVGTAVRAEFQRGAEASARPSDGAAPLKSCGVCASAQAPATHVVRYYSVTEGLTSSAIVEPCVIGIPADMGTVAWCIPSRS